MPSKPVPALLRYGNRTGQSIIDFLSLQLALNDGDGRAVDIDVLENNDGSFTVKYTAPRPGPYQVENTVADTITIKNDSINNQM